MEPKSVESAAASAASPRGSAAAAATGGSDDALQPDPTALPQGPSARPGAPLSEAIRQTAAELVAGGSDWMEGHWREARWAGLAVAAGVDAGQPPVQTPPAPSLPAGGSDIPGACVSGLIRPRPPAPPAGSLLFMLRWGHIPGWMRYTSLAGEACMQSVFPSWTQLGSRFAPPSRNRFEAGPSYPCNICATSHHTPCRAASEMFHPTSAPGRPGPRCPGQGNSTRPSRHGTPHTQATARCAACLQSCRPGCWRPRLGACR